jgi:rod shape-determining protein MreB
VLSKKIGIDVGASTVLVHVRGSGIVVNEAAPPTLDVDTLRRLIARVQGRPRMFKPELMICVPSDISGAQRRALAQAAILAGARQAWLIDEPLAAAIGAGLPIAGARACAVCDIGAATTEVAVIARSGMVAADCIRVGGTALDAAIASYLARRRGVEVDLETAEMIKIEIGSAVPMATRRTIEVDGARVTSDEITEAVEAPLSAIASAVCGVIEQTPGLLLPDLKDRGVVLSGGGSLLRGLDVFLARATGVPAALALEPQTCAARGTGLALDRFEVLRRTQQFAR